MRKTSQEIREGYRQRLILPEFPLDKSIRFFTIYGTLIAQGYERIVIGDRGPYIEFSDSQIAWVNLYIIPSQLWRLDPKYSNCYYLDLRTKDESEVKVYWQKKTVTYADYKIGMWYVSPFAIITDKYPLLIKPLEKKSEV